MFQYLCRRAARERSRPRQRARVPFRVSFLHCRLRALNSGGRQHQSGSAFKAGFGYIVGLPVAAYLTWEGRLIEGKGVSPNIPVGLAPEELLAGEDPQMQKALELVREL
jgi:hypothetical protein